MTPETQPLPPHLKAMIGRGLNLVKDPAERAELRPVVDAIAETTFERWLSRRTGETPLCFLPPPWCRSAVFILFLNKNAIGHEKDSELAARLQEKKARQRIEHMEGGARNAGLLLRELEHPDRPGEPLVAGDVLDRCAAIIARHDYWKLGKPHPAAIDREALVCFEADALWPLHPLGVLADLERPGESGNPKDLNDPGEWRQQIRNNLETLREYRVNWEGTGEVFQDPDSIFRTAEGHRLYREWAGLWGL